MNVSDLNEKDLLAVSPKDAGAYLNARGWIRVVEGFPPAVGVFRRQDARADEILVPMERSFGDYADRIADLVRLFARIEHRTPSQVFEEILFARADVIRKRAVASDTADGTIPFDEHLNFYQSWKKALIAVAESVVDSKRFHARLGGIQAERFFSDCRVGQTARGSYIGTVICPLDAGEENALDIQPPLDGMPAPTFARRVTATFMSTLNDLSQSLRQDTVEGLAGDDRRPKGLSANLAEAVSEMLARTGMELDFTIAWAPSLPPHPETPQTVRLVSEDAGRLERLALQLRPTKIPPEEFVGTIDELRGDPNAELLMEGEVVLTFLFEGRKERSKLKLTPDQYQTAVEAHRNAKYVLVKGKLKLGRRLHQIEEITVIEIVTSTPTPLPT